MDAVQQYIVDSAVERICFEHADIAAIAEALAQQRWQAFAAAWKLDPSLSKSRQTKTDTSLDSSAAAESTLEERGRKSNWLKSSREGKQAAVVTVKVPVKFHTLFGNSVQAEKPIAHATMTWREYPIYSIVDEAKMFARFTLNDEFKFAGKLPVVDEKLFDYTIYTKWTVDAASEAWEAKRREMSSASGNGSSNGNGDDQHAAKRPRLQQYSAEDYGSERPWRGRGRGMGRATYRGHGRRGGRGENSWRGGGGPSYKPVHGYSSCGFGSASSSSSTGATFTARGKGTMNIGSKPGTSRSSKPTYTFEYARAHAVRITRDNASELIERLVRRHRFQSAGTGKTDYKLTRDIIRILCARAFGKKSPSALMNGKARAHTGTILRGGLVPFVFPANKAISSAMDTHDDDHSVDAKAPKKEPLSAAAAAAAVAAAAVAAAPPPLTPMQLKISALCLGNNSAHLSKASSRSSPSSLSSSSRGDPLDSPDAVDLVRILKEERSIPGHEWPRALLDSQRNADYMILLATPELLDMHPVIVWSPLTFECRSWLYRVYQHSPAQFFFWPDIVELPNTEGTAPVSRFIRQIDVDRQITMYQLPRVSFSSLLDLHYNSMPHTVGVIRHMLRTIDPECLADFIYCLIVYDLIATDQELSKDTCSQYDVRTHTVAFRNLKHDQWCKALKDNVALSEMLIPPEQRTHNTEWVLTRGHSDFIKQLIVLRALVVVDFSDVHPKLISRVVLNHRWRNAYETVQALASMRPAAHSQAVIEATASTAMDSAKGTRSDRADANTGGSSSSSSSSSNAVDSSTANVETETALEPMSTSSEDAAETPATAAEAPALDMDEFADAVAESTMAASENDTMYADMPGLEPLEQFLDDKHASSPSRVAEQKQHPDEDVANTDVDTSSAVADVAGEDDVDMAAPSDVSFDMSDRKVEYDVANWPRALPRPGTRRALDVTYNTEQLHILNSVPLGGFHIITGPPGSGKTTLLPAFLCILKAIENAEYKQSHSEQPNEQPDNGDDTNGAGDTDEVADDGDTQTTAIATAAAHSPRSSSNGSMSTSDRLMHALSRLKSVLSKRKSTIKSVLIVAFTNPVVAAIRKKVGRHATVRTIHHVLEFAAHNPYDTRYIDAVKWIFVDESSQPAEALIGALVRWARSHLVNLKGIVKMGDGEQIGGIDAGQPFVDLLDESGVPWRHADFTALSPEQRRAALASCVPWCRVHVLTENNRVHEASRELVHLAKLILSSTKRTTAADFPFDSVDKSIFDVRPFSPDDTFRQVYEMHGNRVDSYQLISLTNFVNDKTPLCKVANLSMMRFMGMYDESNPPRNARQFFQELYKDQKVVLRQNLTVGSRELYRGDMFQVVDIIDSAAANEELQQFGADAELGGLDEQDADERKGADAGGFGARRSLSLPASFRPVFLTSTRQSQYTHDRRISCTVVLRDLQTPDADPIDMPWSAEKSKAFEPAICRAGYGLQGTEVRTTHILVQPGATKSWMYTMDTRAKERTIFHVVLDEDSESLKQQKMYDTTGVKAVLAKYARDEGQAPKRSREEFTRGLIRDPLPTPAEARVERAGTQRRLRLARELFVRAISNPDRPRFTAMRCVLQLRRLTPNKLEHIQAVATGRRPTVFESELHEIPTQRRPPTTTATSYGASSTSSTRRLPNTLAATRKDDDDLVDMTRASAASLGSCIIQEDFSDL